MSIPILAMVSRYESGCYRGRRHFVSSPRCVEEVQQVEQHRLQTAHMRRQVNFTPVTEGTSEMEISELARSRGIPEDGLERRLER